MQPLLNGEGRLELQEGARVPSYSPIVFFAYDRPAHTEAALNSLALNEGTAKSDLYIYCDCPPQASSARTLTAVEQVRQVVRGKQWCGHVEIFEAREHRGCDDSMLHGIESVITAHERVIVLEDDLVVGPHWLSFVNDGLNIYQHDDSVGAISGYMYPVKHYSLPETFFSCFLNFWGWGTWLRAWSTFEASAKKSLDDLKTKRLISRFMLGRPEYIRYLRELEGRRDSYDILWYASLLRAGKLVLYPGQSMVVNKGFDLTGTHLSILDGPNYAFLDQQASRDRLDLKRQAVVEDTKATRAVVDANVYIWPTSTQGLSAEDH